MGESKSSGVIRTYVPRLAAVLRDTQPVIHQPPVLEYPGTTQVKRPSFLHQVSSHRANRHPNNEEAIKSIIEGPRILAGSGYQGRRDAFYAYPIDLNTFIDPASLLRVYSFFHPEKDSRTQASLCFSPEVGKNSHIAPGVNGTTASWDKECDISSIVYHTGGIDCDFVIGDPELFCQFACFSHEGLLWARESLMEIAKRLDLDSGPELSSEEHVRMIVGMVRDHLPEEMRKFIASPEHEALQSIERADRFSKTLYGMLCDNGLLDAMPQRYVAALAETTESECHRGPRTC